MNGPSGFTQTISLAQIALWHDPSATYRIRSRPGTSGITDTVDQPLSIRTLLGHLDPALAPEAVAQLSFGLPRGSTKHSTYLGPDQLARAGENGYELGLLPAVYVAGNGDAIGYTRPLRVDDPNDVNGTVDYWQSNPGEAIRLTIRVDKPLVDVSVKATPSTVKVNKPATFSVAFAGNVDASDFSYAWEFEDGGTATGRAPKHAFSTKGTYTDNKVTVSGPGIADSTAFATVTVEPAIAETPAPTPTPGTGDGTGTDDGSGNNDDPDAPNHGPDDAHGTTTDEDPTLRPGKSAPTTPRTPPSPEAGSAASGLTTVAGAILLGPDGKPVPSARVGASAAPDGTLDLASAGAHQGGGPESSPWLWSLVGMILLAGGALAEMRPWAGRRRAPDRVNS